MFKKIMIGMCLTAGVTTSVLGTELTQAERNHIAVMMIPIYSLILDSKPTEPVAPLPIKKTGQIVSYTNNGEVSTSLKDDAYYQKGVDINYTRDDTKEIVTDGTTGLQWQDNYGAKYTKKQWITDEYFDSTAGNVGPNTNTSGDTAATYCSNLVLGGYSDWRLPTIIELQSIFDYTTARPALDPVFQYVQGSHDNGDTYDKYYYWTSTTFGRKHQQYSAWVIDFSAGGESYNRLKNQSHFVRCVRKENN